MRNLHCRFDWHYIELRLGAQSVTLLSTLRDPTQCATRQQHPFFVANQKEGIDRMNEKYPDWCTSFLLAKIYKPTWTKFTVEILQNFVAFSEYMNFKYKIYKD